MQILSVTGGAPLYGTVPIHGAKNSVLPILAAAVLCRSPCVLHNCPQIEDVDTALEILKCLGCRSERRGGSLCGRIRDGRLRDPRGAGRKNALVDRVSRAGAGEKGKGEAGAAGRLPAGRKAHRPASDGAPRDGRRRWRWRAGTSARRHRRWPRRRKSRCRSQRRRDRERHAGGDRLHRMHGNMERGAGPEIVDLAGFLRSAGAEISGAGGGHITVCGGAPLHGTTYTVLPDRIETATYLCAAAACGGDVTLRQASAETCRPLIALLRGAAARSMSGTMCCAFPAPDA